MHAYLLHNGDIRHTRERLLSPGQVGFMNGWGVFSTLRVADGVLFAFERHYDRMKHDAERLLVPFDLPAPVLQDLLLQLVDKNDAYNATLRVALVRNRGGLFEGPDVARDADLIAFTANLRDWGEGVKLSYMPHARYGASPFAGAKITSWAENLACYERAHENGFDEYVLLNQEGQVSECTSANIFVLQGNEVCTPPLSSSGCLPGVTRALLLEEIRVAGVTITERELTPSMLEESDQIFITSTTRDLLPVLEIDGEPMSQNRKLLDQLRTAFLRYREQYTARHARMKNSVPA
ncbi:MAG: aminotransferase class IV [Acidobacteriaceae bacterium]|nr:aminotransferase class IV [Acidobacteriaceae bacterium]